MLHVPLHALILALSLSAAAWYLLYRGGEALLRWVM